MISIGQTIPDVTSEAYLPDGRIARIRLADFRGKWLVLFFWPLDFTHVCPTEVRAYSDLAHDFDVSGAVLLGASVDSVHVHRNWVRHELGPLGFPMLGDVSREVVRACGLLTDSGVAARASLIVDPDGQVVSLAALDPGVCGSPRETLRLLHALQARALTAREWPSGDAFIAAA